MNTTNSLLDLAIKIQDYCSNMRVKGASAGVVANLINGRPDWTEVSSFQRSFARDRMLALRNAGLARLENYEHGWTSATRIVIL